MCILALDHHARLLTQYNLDSAQAVDATAWAIDVDGSDADAFDTVREFTELPAEFSTDIRAIGEPQNPPFRADMNGSRLRRVRFSQPGRPGRHRRTLGTRGRARAPATHRPVR